MCGKTFGLFAGVEACEKLKAGGFEHKGFISVRFPYLSVALLFFMCNERFFFRLLFPKSERQKTPLEAHQTKCANENECLETEAL